MVRASPTSTWEEVPGTTLPSSALTSVMSFAPLAGNTPPFFPSPPMTLWCPPGSLRAATGPDTLRSGWNRPIYAPSRPSQLLLPHPSSCIPSLNATTSSSTCIRPDKEIINPFLAPFFDLCTLAVVHLSLAVFPVVLFFSTCSTSTDDPSSETDLPPAGSIRTRSVAQAHAVLDQLCQSKLNFELSVTEPSIMRISCCPISCNTSALLSDPFLHIHVPFTSSCSSICFS